MRIDFPLWPLCLCVLCGCIFLIWRSGDHHVLFVSGRLLITRWWSAGRSVARAIGRAVGWTARWPLSASGAAGMSGVLGVAGILGAPVAADEVGEFAGGDVVVPAAVLV